MKIVLSQQTNLSVGQITNWLKKQRRKLKKKTFGVSNRISTETKVILKDGFLKNKNPTFNQISELSVLTGLSHKKIRMWFAKERFKSR